MNIISALKESQRKPYALVFLFSTLSLFLLLILKPGHISYDESYYLYQTELIKEFGISKTFLEKLPGPSGPLFHIIQYLNSPWTHLTLPGVRLVSFFFLLLSSLSLLYSRQKSAFQLGVFFVCCPILVLTGGMALTDILSFFFFNLSLMALFYFYQHKKSSWLLLAGIASGISILGRQIYLIHFLVTSGILLIFFWRKLQAFLFFFVSNLLLFLPVFLIWKGIIPESTRFLNHFSFQPFFILLGLSYSGLFLLFLDLKFEFRLFLFTFFIIIIFLFTGETLSWFHLNSEKALGIGVMRKLLPHQFLPLYARSSFGGLLALGILFLRDYLQRLRIELRNRQINFSLHLTLMEGAFLFSLGKMGNQFAARYTIPIVGLYSLAKLTTRESIDTHPFRYFLGFIMGIFLLLGNF